MPVWTITITVTPPVDNTLHVRNAIILRVMNAEIRFRDQRYGPRTIWIAAAERDCAARQCGMRARNCSGVTGTGRTILYLGCRTERIFILQFSFLVFVEFLSFFCFLVLLHAF